LVESGWTLVILFIFRKIEARSDGSVELKRFTFEFDDERGSLSLPCRAVYVTLASGRICCSQASLLRLLPAPPLSEI